MKRTWVLIAIVAACGKDKGGGGRDEAKKSGCQLGSGGLAALVVGKGPQVLPPFDKGIKLGMSRADAKAACPNLFDARTDAKTGSFSAGEVVGDIDKTVLYASLDFERDKVVAVTWRLPKAAEAALTAAWGAPTTATGAKPAKLWLDDATGTRALLSPDVGENLKLVVSAYAPLRAFVEPETATIAWKPQDVLGKTPAELEKAFPQYAGKDETSAAVKAKTKEMMADLDKQVKELGIDPSKSSTDLEVKLPASPFGSGTQTTVILHLDDDGTVRSYGLWLRTEEYGAYGFPQQNQQLIKLLDEIWGPHKTIKDTLGERATWFDAKRGIRVAAKQDASSPNNLDLAFVRYLPLADLFGAAGPVWGFEKAERPLLGASVEELTALFGKRAEIKDAATQGTATLRLPPTDYDGDTAVTSILMFLEAGKVRQWNLHIPFEDYEPARAEYEALLAAKLGAPKPAPHDHLIYGTGPKVDAEYSKYTHELDLEVTAK